MRWKRKEKKSEINLRNDGDEIEERSTDDDILLKAKTIHEIECECATVRACVFPHFISSSLSLHSLSLFLVRSVHHPFEISIHMSLQNFEFTTSQCSMFFYRRYLAKHLELIDDTPPYRLKTQIPELGKATHCNHSTRAHALGFPFQDNSLKIIRKCMQHTIQIPIFVPYIVDLSEEIPFK